MKSLRRSASLLLPLILFGLSGPALAQRAELDTTRVYELDSITKTAERTSAIVARTTSAMSVLSPQSMHRLPSRSIADWLATAPGLSFFSLDGLGYDPQPVVRGFYGGGEAEYVQLQIDGVPFGDGESGLVNWNMLPLHSLASVEILRGGSSALFGDAALGAVINLVTDPDRRGGIVSVTAGTAVPFEAELSYGGTVADRQFHLFGDYGRIDGFRDNADREIASLGGSLNLLSTDKSKINLSTLHFLSDAAIPGPLFQDLAESTPTETLAYFRFDRVNEGIHTLGVSGNHRVWDDGQLSFRTTGKIRTTDVVETVPLSADFADTQQRDLTDINLSANIQLSTDLTFVPGTITAGIDASSAWIDTDYSALLTGTLDDYSAAPPQPASTLAAEGSGSRQTAAAYIHYSIEPASRLRITAGGRFDVLRDSFTPAGAESRNTTHTAFSPKVGANYRFVSHRNAVGNLYANVSRSFKAPTFDQLYDQRAIPVPFPPFQIALSSDVLEPQTGTSMEVGLYQRIQPISSDIAAEISLALYEINMKDE
ncbi:MAG: TonB-dependent receptor, partial [Rhodothermales bacterium]|nr:TonB-dependent receptor [Rhodothermales bacterium]